ncbi:hypothetical protein RUM43_003950 [Polyplax serrata]|uniref:Uncharacterized protein n=1 Tax=Polyplax serrata TaxID=468196 RepID=A0AAN8S657_POLSC
MDRDGTRVRMVLGVLELRESRFRDTYRRVHVRVRSGTRYLRSADGLHPLIGKSRRVSYIKIYFLYYGLTFTVTFLSLLFPMKLNYACVEPVQNTSEANEADEEVSAYSDTRILRRSKKKKEIGIEFNSHQLNNDDDDDDDDDDEEEEECDTLIPARIALSLDRVELLP